MGTPAARPRLPLLDEVRGFCVLLMVIYHAFFTVGWVFNQAAGQQLFWLFAPLEPVFAGVFIFLCGASCRLSRNNLRRGLLLLAVAEAMSLVLWLVMPEDMIWFGVLQLLAVCILLFVPLRPLCDRLPPLAGLLGCAVLFLLLWWFPNYQGGYIGPPVLGLQWPAEWELLWWLNPLGIGVVKSADYFPLLPWVFCFFGGSFAGVWLRDELLPGDRPLPAVFYRRHCPPLAWCGRVSLWIYLAHQPVIYGLCLLTARFFVQG